MRPQGKATVKGDSEECFRYRFEIFSGKVTRIRSEAIDASKDVFVSIARFLRLWKSPPIRAIHEMIVTTPSGIPRTFRFATEFSDVPAMEGDRVSIVCAPAINEEKNFGIFAPIPPSVYPGDALSLTNHNTSITASLLRAPKTANEGIPSWIVPTTVVLAGTNHPYPSQTLG